jgi:predicted DsbA family dithiol-disulfide isomerase
VSWLPFDLHPEYPAEGIPRSELDRRYGDDHREHVRRIVEECGYTYDPPPNVVPNSRKALELTEFARDAGLHPAVHDRLMDAYWSEAQNIGDEETLLSLVAEAGLDRAEAADALADGRYRDRIAASTREANLLGINAIPAFVLDERLLLVGAYPQEVFERAFDQLASMEST